MVVQSKGTVNISSSNFITNTAKDNNGGAIYALGNIIMIGSSFTENNALVDGGAAIDGRVAHIHTNAAMIHQCGHSMLLLCRRGRGQAVGHIGPIVVGVGKVGRLNAIARIVAIGMAALAESRIVPILHHLCHGGGHTAGHGVARAIHVIG